jgi:hypothetical protein
MQFYYSKSKVIQIACPVLLGLAYFYPKFSNLAVHYFTIAFAIIVLWSVAKLLMRKEPVYIIDENGVSDNSPKGCGLIPWSEITKLEVIKTGAGNALGIAVKDEEKYFSKVPQSKRIFIKSSQSFVAIYFMLISPSFDDALEYVRTMHTEKIDEETLTAPKTNAPSWKFMIGYTVMLIIGALIIFYFQNK